MTSPENDLDEWLASLREAGRYESTGSFTVDYLKAREKLRRYRLPHPEDYILKFVQGAVRRLAARIDVEAWTRTLTFRYDGAAYSLAELETLVQHLFQETFTDEQRDLRHLAVGLNASLQPGVECVLLESWQDGQGAFLLLDEHEQRTGMLPPTRIGRSGTRISIRKKTMSFDREQAALRERARFSPAPLLWNRMALPHGDFGTSRLPPFGVLYTTLLRLNEEYIFGQAHRHHHAVEILWPDESCQMALAVPSQATDQWAAQDLHHGVQRCRQALAIEMDLHREARFQLVQDGVEMQTLYRTLETWGVCGILSVDELTPDLSGLQIVQDDRLDTRLSECLEGVPALLSRLRLLIEFEPDRLPLVRLLRGRFLGKRYGER